MKSIFVCAFSLFFFISFGQSYNDSMNVYLKNYVQNHEVVKGDDKKKMNFFPINEKYRVVAQFQSTTTNQWFEMPTSGKLKKVFRLYGILTFKINDTLVHMNLYQSQGLMGSEEYKNYLFLPFTDATTGVDTYESGRYIDLQISDIKNNQVILDFNKAYNPYCAYVRGIYNCPIPPRENHLFVAILAGEKSFGGH